MDEYPFIFLTLMLSLQASYAAPLILLAQNRQEQRDKVIAEQDRQANARAHADMEFLAREVASLRMAVGEVATRDFVRSELRSLLAELDERAAEPARPLMRQAATRREQPAADRVARPRRCDGLDALTGLSSGPGAPGSALPRSCGGGLVVASAATLASASASATAATRTTGPEQRR